MVTDPQQVEQHRKSVVISWKRVTKPQEMKSSGMVNIFKSLETSLLMNRIMPQTVPKAVGMAST